MRECDLKEMSRLSVIGLLALAVMVISLLLGGCSSVQYVPVETVRYDSIYISKILHDSIYQKDSVFIDRSGDTVYIYKDKYVYKYKNLTDTMYVTKVDSVQVPYPVEKKLTRWQAMKVELGGWAMGIIIAFAVIIVGWLVFRMRRK